MMNRKAQATQGKLKEPMNKKAANPRCRPSISTKTVRLTLRNRGAKAAGADCAQPARSFMRSCTSA